MVSENSYYRAQVKVEFETDKGKIKYRKDNYLVHAVSVTDAEAKVVKALSDQDIELISVAQVNYVDIIK